MEYAESREYAIGDDARHIDWRLTARSGRPHTKLFQAERERLTLIVADTAPTLYFGTRVRFKSVQAARAGAIAAWAALRDGDRIAALRGSQREAPMPPAAGPRGALRVLDALVRWYAAAARRRRRPGGRARPRATPAAAGFAPGRARRSRQHRRDSRRIAGRRSRMHHEVIVLLLVDPLERDPPKAALPFAQRRRSIASNSTSPAAAQRQRWRNEFVAPLEAALQALARARRARAGAVAPTRASDAWLPLLGPPQASVA